MGTDAGNCNSDWTVAANDFKGFLRPYGSSYISTGNNIISKGGNACGQEPVTDMQNAFTSGQTLISRWSIPAPKARAGAIRAFASRLRYGPAGLHLSLSGSDSIGDPKRFSDRRNVYSRIRGQDDRSHFIQRLRGRRPKCVGGSFDDWRQYQ